MKVTVDKCRCGCGAELKPGRTYLKSHQFVRPVEVRFWEKVNRTDTCWLWTAATNGRGYGRFGVGGRMVYAHRFAYEQAKGAIPAGADLDHLCRVTLCVNPDHLEAVSHRENILRGEWFIAKNAAKTHCKYEHEFTKENTVLDRGARACLTCRRARERSRAPHRRAGRDADRG